MALTGALAAAAGDVGLLQWGDSSVHENRRAESSSRYAVLPPLPKAGSFTECRNLFPNSRPFDVGLVDAKWKAVALCSNNFAVLHSGLTKTPMFAVERLNKEQLASAQDEKRTNEFFPDPRLSEGQRSELDDYRGSKHDRGHNAPAGDEPDPESMAQSFSLSNMVPQDPTNNRKIWSKVESDVRKYVRRAQGNVFVFTGPIFGANPETIGRDQVWVPASMFKLVYDEVSHRSWAYILPNIADTNVSAPVSYAQFIERTGWHLLP